MQQQLKMPNVAARVEPSSRHGRGTAASMVAGDFNPAKV
jgi:hypothetical protein